MKENLKILFIPRWYPNRVNPMSGIFIKRHALAVALKHKVAVLFVNADPCMKDKIYDSEFSNEDGILSVRVYYNNSIPAIPFISRAIKFYRYFKSCKKGIGIMEKEFGTPDISHIHVLARTFFIAYFYQYFHKVPFVVSEQWSGYLPEDGLYKGFFKNMLTQIAIRKASAVTTVSESLKNAMRNHGLENNYSIIPNVADVNLFSPVQYKKSRTKVQLLTVAVMDNRAKNISGVINVMKKLREIRTDFEYHIIGDGEDRLMLEKLASENDLLNSFVFFEGSKISEEVAGAMRQVDLFILFSNYDNMPCVMVESFASGIPVIGSDIHGMKEHIKEGRGIVVPPGNEEALLNAILSAIEKLNSFDKNLIRKYAEDNFSYQAVVNKFDLVYQKVI